MMLKLVIRMCKFQMNQLCKVCGEPAAGFHFGAFTCEGCKVSTVYEMIYMYMKYIYVYIQGVSKMSVVILTRSRAC
jgi:hypothetical protein